MMRQPGKASSGVPVPDGDYVLVSGEEQDLEIHIPSNIDPRAFLEQVPWQVATMFRGPQRAGNPWKHARLYVKGKLVDEFFFIADAWPKTRQATDERQIA